MDSSRLHEVKLVRRIVASEIVLTAFELVMVAWPLLRLFRLLEERRAVISSVGIPVLAGALLLWSAALASWLTPIARLAAERMKGFGHGENLIGSAHRSLTKTPLRAVWLRTGLWMAVAVSLGITCACYCGWSPARVAALVSIAALHAFIASVPRSAWYSFVFDRLRRQLLPEMEPVREFGKCYVGRLLLAALCIGAAALAALAAFFYFFLPITEEEYLKVQAILPALIATANVGWYFYVRLATRPIDSFLRHHAEPEEQEKTTHANHRGAIVAYRRAQSLPYRLAVARAAAWILAAGIVAAIARAYAGLALDDALLIFGAAVVTTVGSAIYETVWHRETMRP
ncbi:MAG: hypothetical protein V2A73_15115, partial [Pseudomonadota bacterium]